MLSAVIRSSCPWLCALGLSCCRCVMTVITNNYYYCLKCRLDDNRWWRVLLIMWKCLVTALYTKTTYLFDGLCVTLGYLCWGSADLYQLEMWANAQRDGRPAEYRWRPLFNAAKFGWRRLLECRAVTLPRSETRWNLQGCPKLVNRSQPLVGGGPKFTVLSGHVEEVLLFNSFFRLSIHSLVAKI